MRDTPVTALTCKRTRCSVEVTFRTALALGLRNLVRVAWYRAGVELGLNPVRRMRARPPQGLFFGEDPRPLSDLVPSVAWQQQAKYFGIWPVTLGYGATDWHANPLNGSQVAAPEREWWQIPDFDPAVGDIKVVWEASRFDWVLAFAQQYRAGEPGALDRLNGWLADWCTHNSPYRGPNWKCGQEASIRVMHLAMAAVILNQVRQPSAALVALIQLHLKRIAPTIGYAMAQDNNHGTSEAGALFIGGSWLAAQGVDGGEGWHRLGRKWLENRAERLIAYDGSFSQYSVNYHRVMLDTLSMVEVWRRQLNLSAFSASFQQRAAAATSWLYQMVCPETGDAPNLGANDGARLLPLADTGFRDYRPSVHLASVLFAGRRAWAQDGPWDLPLRWLGITLPESTRASPESQAFDDGGYAVLRRGGVMALLRYPRFRFRPSQADALHVDLWKDGVNLLRDAGSYSYNTDAEWLAYFPGTASHNTIQFDGRDQMPRLSRFLFGDWLKTKSIESLTVSEGSVAFGAVYRDRQGAFHHRRITLSEDALLVEDQVSGFRQSAVLRWRLAPGDWRAEGSCVTNGVDVIKVSSTVPIIRIGLVEGWESRYYLEKTSLSVLEVELQQAGSITSEYRWNA